MPECLEDYFGPDNLVRVVDAFVEALGLADNLQFAALLQSVAQSRLWPNSSRSANTLNVRSNLKAAVDAKVRLGRLLAGEPPSKTANVLRHLALGRK